MRFYPLFDLIDVFEPLRVRRLGIESKNLYYLLPKIFDYTGSIIKLKDVLLHLEPKFKHALDDFERVYRSTFQWMLYYVEKSILELKCKISALLVSLSVFEVILELQHLPNIDTSVLDHLGRAVRCRITILHTQLHNSTIVRKHTGNKKLELAAQGLTYLLQRPEKAVLFQPLSYSGFSHSAEIGSQFWNFSPFYPGNVIDSHRSVPPCMRSVSSNGDNCHGISQSNNCYCGWIFVCIPDGLSQLRDFCADSIAGLFHDSGSFPTSIHHSLRERVEWLGFKHVFSTSKIMIFRSSLLYAVKSWPNILYGVLIASKGISSRVESQTSKSDTMILGKIRTTVIISIATLIFRYFRASRNGDQLETMSIEELMLSFHDWISTWNGQSRRMRQDINKFLKQLIEIEVMLSKPSQRPQRMTIVIRS